MSELDEQVNALQPLSISCGCLAYAAGSGVFQPPAEPLQLSYLSFYASAARTIIRFHLTRCTGANHIYVYRAA